ncbi:MAG TPA: VanZ family protein [Candidatus Acidoferrales bacterium]|nr:VanZ family protein [Candidatus Acidoferrales bacterium]
MSRLPSDKELRQERLSILGHWGVVALWMLVISTLSGEPFSAQNTNEYIDPVLRFLFPHFSVAELLAAHTVIRKTAHLTEFFILGTLTYWASRRGRQPAWRARWMLQSIILAGCYALLDEAHQMFVPDRTPSLWDSGIDSLGAAISQVVIYLRHRFGPATLTPKDDVDKAQEQS